MIAEMGDDFNDIGADDQKMSKMQEKIFVES